MDALHAEITARMARSVARLVRHAEAEGMTPGALDGRLTLVISEGRLSQVVLPAATPKGKPVVLDVVPQVEAGDDSAPADALSNPDDQVRP
jgi:hypothetical protein